QRCVGVIFFDHVEKMGNLRLALGGTRIALEMPRNEGDAAPAQLDLRADRHAAANPLLAARRPEPAAIGLETDHEGTMKADGARYGIAMNPERVALVAAGRDLILVAQAELDELDAIGEAVPEPGGQLGEAMPVARPNHALVDLAKKRDVRLVPGHDLGD